VASKIKDEMEKRSLRFTDYFLGLSLPPSLESREQMLLSFLKEKLR
jgi:hypothetical protein